MVPWCTLMNTASFRLGLPFARPSPLPPQFRWAQVNFMLSGDFHSGYTSNDFNSDTVNWLNSYVGNWVCDFPGLFNRAWIITTPSKVRTCGSAFLALPGTTSTGYCVQNFLPIRLRTAHLGRTGMGVVRFNGFLSTDLILSRTKFNPNAQWPRFKPFYTTPMTFGGVTFTPCVWSRKDGVCRPIVEVDIGATVGWLRHRRDRPSKTFNPVPWLVNW